MYMYTTLSCIMHSIPQLELYETSKQSRNENTSCKVKKTRLFDCN